MYFVCSTPSTRRAGRDAHPQLRAVACNRRYICAAHPQSHLSLTCLELDLGFQDVGVDAKADKVSCDVCVCVHQGGRPVTHVLYIFHVITLISCNDCSLSWVRLRPVSSTKKTCTTHRNMSSLHDRAALRSFESRARVHNFILPLNHEVTPSTQIRH